MTREELIEVMARAMHDDWNKGDDWKRAGDTVRLRFIRDAAAALAAIEAAGVRLVYPGEARAQLIDGDERTTVRIFTPYASK